MKTKNEDNCKKKDLECQSLIIDDVNYQTLYTEKYKNRKKWKPINNAEIYSYIPGTITSIFIKEGQEVKSNEKALIFEAMKMMNTVTVPYDGIIKKIYIKEGQRIPKGMLIFEME